ncbi:heterokaryon incompatibility protein-domain-containing protein [Aspergillus cavernicola]|uniref:Heterokaryon incompatibility protein-domain-containing protein n=1 Tax=Aspergillus cavernicola TaxID=176166 RepID=A0ABR4HI34_9EURO
MYRWHESGCRRPDVSTASGLPCCSYCFAIPSLEDDVIQPQPLPQLQDPSQMNLTWPAVVTYSDWGSERKYQEEHGGRQSYLPDSVAQKSLLPELPSGNIRLLRLKPGTTDSLIHAEYETVRINQIPLPLYEALSYTSVDDPADSSESCPVFIGSFWDVAYVSNSCGKALRRFRRQKADRLLWVDSLCIDHRNPEEKNTQVHITRDIYSRATKVLADIGHESSDFSLAFGYLKEITAFQPTPSDCPPILDNVRGNLKTLLQQPYFSCLWPLQETLMAREVEMVCGSLSARWPRRPFRETYPDLDIPSWLFKDPKWYPFTGKDLLSVLVNASPYQCSDPRDKVFVPLGLVGEKDIAPDYRLPVESVYTGIAAYFIKNWHAMDLLALAGQKNKSLDLPSWVPDWSQSLSLPSLDDFLRPGARNDLDDGLVHGAICTKFSGRSTAGCDIEIESATGAMRLQGFKLCRVLGELIQVKDYTHVQMPPRPTGSFIISIPHQNYQIHESDFLFVLNGYDYPIILREGGLNTYSLVTACVLSTRWHSPKLLMPWYWRQRRQPSSELIALPLAPEDDHFLQQLYSRIETIPPLNSTSPPPAATIRTRVLSYLMLSQTTIQGVEKWLRVDWDKWNRELGWMFRDQSAIWQFLLEVNQLSSDERSGEDRISLRRVGSLSITNCGKEFPSTYTWDLTHFFWSFIQPTAAAQSLPELHWSPMVDQLRSHLPEIRQWAQVTEQLLKVFEYSAAALGENWESFPGTQLPQKWTRNYENFLAISESSLNQEMQRRPHLRPDSDCLWKVTEFENHLRAREDIWGLRSSSSEEGLGYAGIGNIEAHALLTFLGLDLYNEHCIKIV